ncbi:FAD-dependent monooxygenase [Penicillium nucicola]|uniref:FAD-dependent monooxygenase n=1 Tax=Penicillium nucicola TaxID=1850975 RepID=UPI002544DDC4|nr:FAD-dependent monooxygenase [Penicillium nucicola]KAJ5770266.1 FAD-dependent monooxygenase [Penicillium nucicola]
MPTKFQVIVIGGSIAGLTLAHCLDHAGIDYIILEKQKHSEAIPGAFITVAPNGARILDQLGLYDAVKTVSQPTRLAHVSYLDGSVLKQQWPIYVEQRCVERYFLLLSGPDTFLCRLGYPFCTMTRQQLMYLLMTKLKDKSKVYLNKKVVSIHTEDSVISVSTADGGKYYGDLVVGADGVHSITRSEMWRIANIQRPGLITGDMTNYRCVFGTSDPVPGIIPGEQIMKCHDGLTIIIFGGKDGLIGWCAVQRLDKTHRYPNIPRYLQADAVSLCERLTNLPIRNDLRFGNIWDRRKSVVMTALEEGLLQTWNYGRIVCIGDSVNKTAPTMGQGANIAIESAAALANGLHGLLQTSPDQSPSDETIIRILDALSHTVYLRFRTMSGFCQTGTRVLAREGIVYTFLGRYILLRSDHLIGLWLSKILAAGVTLEYLPPTIMRQSHTQGHNDRLYKNFSIFALFSVALLWITTKVFFT